MHDIMKSVISFIQSANAEKEWIFKNGMYLKLKKQADKGVCYLDISTSGYDGQLEQEDAIEWIKWTLLDYESNGYL